jgi:hypothetical protein
MCSSGHGNMEMESLLMGTGYKPLQSVNYHDSRAHSYELSGSSHMISGF